MNERMNAVRIHRYGRPDVLAFESVPRPEVSPGKVLVRVAAAGVNPVDWKTREGGGAAAMIGSLPWIPGWDLAGTVVAAGAGVVDFVVGQRVFGMISFPAPGSAYAEYVVAEPPHLVSIPPNMDDISAAALPLAALTAWQALVEEAQVQPGERVLIHGAAGGVGHLAVQFARSLGATVYGTASASNVGFLRALGVERVIDYASEQFDEALSELDVVLDCVGGAVRDRSYGVLREGGRLVTLPDNPSLERAAAVGVRASRIVVRPEREHLQEVVRLWRIGEIKPEIDRVIPLSRAAEAHELSEAGHVRGKLVLDVIGS